MSRSHTPQPEDDSFWAIADVEPLDVNGVRTVQVGTAVWTVAFLALLPFWNTLQADGHLWWLWTCMAGIGLGLFGIEYCKRRAARTPRS